MVRLNGKKFSLLAFIYLNTRGAWLALFPVLLFIILYYVPTWKRKIAILGCLCILISGGLAISPSFSSRVQSISNSDGKQQSVNERFLMCTVHFRWEWIIQ